MQKGIIILAMLAATTLAACGNDQSQQQAAVEKTPAEKGALIFNEKCSICHAMKREVAGPALEGVLARWDNDANRLKAFIRNSQESIGSGDPAAVRVYEKYKAPMPPFTSLSDEELNQLVEYLKK